MKLSSNAMPPYKINWVDNPKNAEKWLTLRLEEGYVLDSANGATIPTLMPNPDEG